MLILNRLAKWAGFAMLAGALVTMLPARTRKGDKLLAESRAAELRKDWDKAIQYAEQALSEDPAEIAYQLTASRLRFYVGQFHIEQGLKLREQGHLQEALAELQKGYGINPASTMAAQEIERTKQMIEEEKVKPQKPGEKVLTPGEAEKAREEKKFEAMEPLPELKPLNPEPIYLKMNNQPPKVLFETVGKYAGINVLFDPDYSATGGTKPQSIELNNSTLNEALDDIALITKSFWKPISANTIFVTQDNPTTRRNYEDWVTKVVYLNNVLTTQELTEIISTVRSVVELQKAFPYGAENAIVMRGEADKVALAEKIIADLDKPRSEVLVDVLVMTTSRNKELDLAAAVAPGGLNSSINFTPRSNISVPNNAGTSTSTTTTTTTTGSSSTNTTIPLSNIGVVSTRDFSLTLPGGLLNALLTDATTRVLQRPQVRAVDRQKVEMKIGEKVPYATGSFQPGIGGVGINPLVNTQFTFLDTGVNINVTPYVHNANEVSLHVEVDISNVTGSVPLGGINEPEVAQTKITNDVRLKQGEVNLMGGLMQVSYDKNVSGVPGLMNIPLVGHLFQSQTNTTNESELVIVLIPHILRYSEATDVNLKTIDSGNQTNVRLKYAPPQQEAPPAPQPQGQAQNGNAPAAQPVPQAVPVVAVVPPNTAAAAPNVASPPRAAPASASPVRIPGINAPPSAVPPMIIAPPAPPARSQAQPQQAAPTQQAGKASVKFVPAQATAHVNGTITVSLMVDNATDLAAAPMQIRFDPKVLRLNDVVRGNLLANDDKQVAFSKNIMNDTGEATVSVSRFPQTGGVSGSGSIVTLVFQAVGAGDTVVTVPSLTLRNSRSQAILTTTPVLAVSVK